MCSRFHKDIALDVMSYAMGRKELLHLGLFRIITFLDTDFKLAPTSVCSHGRP